MQNGVGKNDEGSGGLRPTSAESVTTAIRSSVSAAADAARRGHGAPEQMSESDAEAEDTEGVASPSPFLPCVASHTL